MNDQKFNVGDKVQWTSQSNSSQVTKTGKVLVVVIPNMTLEAAINRHNNLTGQPLLGTRYRFMFDAYHSKRDHESYIVEVNDSKTGKGKPKLYWPRVSNLKKLAR